MLIWPIFPDAQEILALMLLTWKEDNTIGSLYICHLFYVLSVIVISGYECVRYKSALIYSCYMYRWNYSGHVSVFAIRCCMFIVLLTGHILLLMHVYEYYVIMDVSMSLFMSL